MKTTFGKSASIKSPLLLFSYLFCITTYVEVGEAARILGIFASPAPSHNLMFQALLRVLAERGHIVEVASPYPLSPPKPKSYTDVILPVPHDKIQALISLNVASNNTPWGEHYNLWSFAEPLCEVQLSSPELKRYLSRDDKVPKFDLVIVELFFFDCLIGFAHHFNVPLVGMVSQFALPWPYTMVGNPIPYSMVPNTFLRYGPNMSLLERLHNILFTSAVTLYRRFISLPKQTEIAKRYFGSDMPPIWEIEKRISLVLLNGHPAVSPVHSTMPNLVDVAGMHILANPPPLPKDLQDILDKNKNVILFSLGSMINSKTIKEERLLILLNALKEMPCKVIWRWDGDASKLPSPLPPNVHIFKWLPQQSLLAHPNLGGFVTHGGLLSLQEATYHGVPIVGFPFFGDQFLNLNYASKRGIAITLDFYSFSKENLVDGVTKLLNDPSYRINAKKLSSVFRDQPETPIERGVYWIEHVLRHKGADHMRSGAMDLNWFQYYLLDVIFLVLFSLVASCMLFYMLCKILISLLFGKKRKSKKD